MAEQGQGQSPRHPGVQVTGSRADEQAVRGAQHLFHRGLVQGFHTCFLLRLTSVPGDASIADDAKFSRSLLGVIHRFPFILARICSTCFYVKVSEVTSTSSAKCSWMYFS